MERFNIIMASDDRPSNFKQRCWILACFVLASLYALSIILLMTSRITSPKEYSYNISKYWASDSESNSRKKGNQTSTNQLHNNVRVQKGHVFQTLSSCFTESTNLTCLKTGTVTLKDSFRCQHLMTLRQPVVGRTGNQLFEVASLLGSARYHGYTAVVHSSLPLAKLFDLPNVSNLKLSRKTVREFYMATCCTFDERIRHLNHATNWTLGGWRGGKYESWRFFEGSEDIVRKAFKIKKHFAEDAKYFIKSTLTKLDERTKSVCIHVRRGDFLRHQKYGLTVAPIEYISRAVEYFRNRFKHVHFFIVSNDKRWCKTNLKWDNVSVTVSPFVTVGHDMALMMASDHVIVSSGTFGWWGAWLSGGDVVYWTGYPGKGTFVGNMTNYTDYYPPHWIGL